MFFAPETEKADFSGGESCTAACWQENYGRARFFEAFLGGVVSYSNESKNRLLSVPHQLLDSCGAVSREVAKSMAVGALQTLGANLALAITGVAGPAEDERHNPVGLVYVALASSENVWSCAFHLGSDRSRIRTRAVSHALDMLRRYLAGWEIEEFSCATKP